MRDRANPPVNLTYVLLSGAATAEQIRDRLQSNADFLQNYTPEGEEEQSVEITVEEAKMMARDLHRVAALLRKLGEGRI